MNENEVKKAFDEIEPKSGAQERMYANILKKAAAQGGEKSAEGAQAVRRPIPMWKRVSAMAACLVIAATVTLGFLHPFLVDGGEGDEPPVLAVSPFEDVQSAADFEKLGFTIDAPAGAESVTYCICDGEIARVDFTLGGHEYTYEAAKLEGNFSRAGGDAVGSTSLNAEYGATLDRLSPDSWRAHWSRGDVSCYLTNLDGAEEADVTAVAQTLIESK